MRMAGAAFEKGLECFTQALALEPTYAQAHAGIAMVQGLRTALSFVGPHTVMPMAKEAALKGLAIDETVADAHLALAMVLQFYEWNWAGAEREYRLALDLNPGDANARRWYAVLLAQRGHKDPAIAGARHAVERDPLEVNLRHSLSLVLCMAGRFEAAIAEAHAGLELDSAHFPLYWNLGWAMAGLDRCDEAVEALRQATVIGPADPVSHGWLGWALGLAGQRQEALAILGELEQRRRQAYIGSSLLAWVCLGLGDHDQAISWLHRSAEKRDGLLTFANVWFVPTPRLGTACTKPS